MTTPTLLDPDTRTAAPHTSPAASSAAASSTPTAPPALARTVADAAAVQAPVGPGTAPRWRRIAHLAGVIALSLLLALLAAAVAVPGWLAPYPPLAADTQATLQAPSAAHLLGTDPIGRDVLSRLTYGARYSLSIGVGATLLAAIIGTVLGTLAGIAPRAADEVIVRLLDVVNAVPEILLALVVIAIVGPGPLNIIIAIGIAAIPRFARVVRVQVRALQHSGWVEGAVTQGLGFWHRVGKHIVPNTIGPVVVLATIGTGTAILNAAGLSFLGLGPQPPVPEWGAVLAESRDYFNLGWWVAVFPGLAVLGTVCLITVVGRRLQHRYQGTGA